MNPSRLPLRPEQEQVLIDLVEDEHEKPPGASRMYFVAFALGSVTAPIRGTMSRTIDVHPGDVDALAQYGLVQALGYGQSGRIESFQLSGSARPYYDLLQTWRGRSVQRI
jgi:hypothetical protein